MEYSTTSPTSSGTKALSMSNLPIDPNAELFDDSLPSLPPTMGDLHLGPSAPPPAGAPPAIRNDHDDDDDDEDQREREIEGGGGTGSDVLHLSVTDPQELGEGRNRHTFYRIDVRPNSYSDPISSVRRRYSDFQWLFQRLHAEKPGAIIPIIPHTQAVQVAKRFSEELVEERRDHLERFLRGVQVHPELEGAPSLSVFFSPDAEIFEAAKRENPSTNSDDLDSPSGNFTEKAKHFFVKTGIKAKVMRGKAELEETSDGAAFEEVELYLNTLDTHIKSISKATKFLVTVSQEQSTNMHELGQTLFGLVQTYDPSKAENNSNNNNDNHDNNDSTNKNNLPTIKVISNVFASLSAIHKVKYDENSSKVTTPLQTLEWSLKSARFALKRRKERQLTYNTYLQQIKNRQAALDKLKDKEALNPQHTPASDAQLSNAQTSLDNAKHNANKALEDLDSVSQRVFREMDRFKENVDESLRKIYVAHAKVQVDYSRQLDAEWNKMLPVVKGNGGGGNGVGSASGMGINGAPTDAEVLMI